MANNDKSGFGFWSDPDRMQRMKQSGDTGGLLGITKQGFSEYAQPVKQGASLLNSAVDYANQATGKLGQGLAGLIAGPDAKEAIKQSQLRWNSDFESSKPSKPTPQPQPTRPSAEAEFNTGINPDLLAIRQNQQKINAGYSAFLDQAAQARGINPQSVRGGLTGVLNEDDQRKVRSNLINALPSQDGAVDARRGHVTAQGQQGYPYTSSNARFQGLSGDDEARPAMIRNASDTENIGVDLGRGNYMVASNPNQRTSAGAQRVLDRLQSSGGLDGLAKESRLADARANEDRGNRELLTRDSLVSQLSRASTNQDYQGVQALAQGLGGLQSANSQRDTGRLAGEQQAFTQDLTDRQMAMQENAQLFDQNLKTIEAEDKAVASSLAKFNQQAQLDYLQSGDDTKLKSIMGLTQAMNQVKPDQWEEWLASSISSTQTNVTDLLAEYMLAMKEGKPVMDYKEILDSQLKSLEVYAGMFDTMKGKKQSSR